MSLPARLLPLLFAASTLPLSQVLFPGCATLVDGATQSVHVKSQPAGARVFLNGRLIGSTPATLVVSRWGRHRIRLEMPGFKPQEIPLEKEFNNDASANIFIGEVWIIVDVVTGAIFQLDVPAKMRPDLLTVTWGDDRTGITIGRTKLTISTTLQPEPAARWIGRLEPETSARNGGQLQRR